VPFTCPFLYLSPMKSFLLILLFAPLFSVCQQIVPDTTVSQTQLYVALNTRNTFYKREEYDLPTEKLDFTAIVLSSLTGGTRMKGCRILMIAGNRGLIPVYFDEPEISDIITTLKYIKDNINLEQKPDHDIWVYYKTADNFEVGAKASKNGKYRIYFRKNFRFLPDDESSMNRKDLDEVYESFVNVRNFLQLH
jgi:hypothetical protein